MKTNWFTSIRRLGLVVLLFHAGVSVLPAQTEAADAVAGSTNRPPARASDDDAIAKIRDEGLNRSQAMATLSYLTEAIGPRLTGSPAMKRANEWTRDSLKAWGLSNARLEPWGPFGRGWALKRFSVQVVEPYAIPLVVYPKAWSPGLRRPINAEVVFLDARAEADLEKHRGKLRGAAVLTAAIREVNPRFEPLSVRLGDSELLRLANVSDPRYTPPYEGRASRGGGTNAATGGPRRGGGGRGGGANFSGRVLSFLLAEGAALAITPSSEGDGGVVFVSSASLPTAAGSRGGTNAPGTPRVWSPNAPATIPQVALGIEDYNRLVRMIQHGEKPKIAAEYEVEFHDDDLMAYNTIAELPGGDLKDEVVMIGAHLDSWHVGTGATDNGTGVAACMEAMRILKALDLKPRRTIRVALWTGEEQGLLGSRAYVSNHFGYNPGAGGTRSSGSGASDAATRTGSTSAANRAPVRHKEFETFSAYFNLDHGAGKIRGIYLLGNEAARPLLARWLRPFADLGANTITLSNSGGTDHVPFDSIGLPGFPFIQDPLDYWTRTHHSSADVLDRVPTEDLKQASTIMAAIAWQAAMSDEKVPRKP